MDERALEQLRDELHAAMNERADWQARAEKAERERDEARGELAKTTRANLAAVARWENAEANNAVLLEALQRILNAANKGPMLEGENGERVAQFQWDPIYLATEVASVQHPGAALLEERRRIQKTLDKTGVPSEADESEKGRACDLAGRVELLASWGRRGWMEYQRGKSVETKLLKHIRALENVREAVEPYRERVSLMPLDVLEREGVLLLETCAAADALKVAP